MSDNARRRRAPARSHGPREQDPGRRSQPARRGGEPTGRPARRGGKPAGRAGGRPSRPVRPAQPDPYAGLDRALSDAAAQPAPASASFGQLGLPERLISALAARNIHEPFAIQARALPDAMAGRDVLGRAQTGSGKTLAFGLPMLTRLTGTAGPKGAPRGLVLVPTRELAQQVADVLTPLGRSVGVTVTTVYGGVPYGRQITQLRNGVDIVVATPGRLIDLLDRGACTLSGIEITVLDEADHMADLGFLPAVTRILDETPAGGQRMLFSATLDRRVGQLVTRYLNDPALHAVAPQAETASVAEHSVLVLHAAGQTAGSRGDRQPAGADPVLRPDQARRGPARPAAEQGRGGRRGHSRQPEPEPAAARAGRVRGRPPAGPRRHRRRRARHPRRRRRAGRALRSAQRP